MVATKYGTKLATFLKNMAIAPDNTTYDFAYSMNHGNYLNLNSSSTIKLSDGLEFKVSDSLNLRKNSILHGRGNYVASLRFLYTVAKNLVNNAYYGTKIQILQSAINDSLGSNDVANHTFYGDNKTYCYPDIKWEHYTEDYQYIARVEKSKEFTAEKQRLYLEKFIYLVANTYFTGQNNAYDEVLENYSNASPQFATIVALKIIGIATHLCGDIYAHKTVVPLDTTFTATVVPSTRNNKTIYRGKAHVDNADGTKTYYDFNGLGRWSMKNGIKTLIEKGSTITTQQITQWQNKNTTAGYPDSTAFYNERLSVGATKLVENMYKNFFDGDDLGTKKFYLKWFLHNNYSLRLANLYRYAYLSGVVTDGTDIGRLKQLDSVVSVSDVAPAGNYTTPSDNPTTWNKGYLSYSDN